MKSTDSLESFNDSSNEENGITIEKDTFSSDDTDLESKLGDFIIPPVVIRLPGQTAQSTSRCPSLTTISKVVLSLVGLGASAFYWQPGLICAQSDNCGKWLTNLTNEQFAHAVFTFAGGAGFGLGNAYLARFSLTRMTAYLHKHKGIANKSARFLGITAMSATQTLPLLFACIGTDAPLWESIMTVSGGIPAALFGVVGLLENEFPHITSTISWKTRVFYLNVISHLYSSLTAEQVEELQIMAHYEKEHTRLVNQADANWKSILNAIHQPQLALNPLNFLFQPEAEYIAPGIIENMSHMLTTATGIVLALNFSSAFARNTHDVIHSQLDSEALSILFTVLLNIAQVYGNLKLTTRATNGLVDIIKSILTGYSIESLSFQTRKKLTATVVMACTAIAALSYASANIISDRTYDGPYKDIYMIGAMLGINIYHYSGMFQLYEMLLGELTHDKNENFLFEVRDELLSIHKMSPAELRLEVIRQTTKSHIMEVNSFGTDAPDDDVSVSGVKYGEDELSRTTATVVDLNKQIDNPSNENSRPLYTSRSLNRGAYNSFDDASETQNGNAQTTSSPHLSLSRSNSLGSSLYKLFSRRGSSSITVPAKHDLTAGTELSQSRNRNAVPQIF